MHKIGTVVGVLLISKEKWTGLWLIEEVVVFKSIFFEFSLAAFNVSCLV